MIPPTSETNSSTLRLGGTFKFVRRVNILLEISKSDRQSHAGRGLAEGL